MEFKRIFASTAPYLLPIGVCQKVCNEAWQKDQLNVKLRDEDEALIIKTIPLPYLEIGFEVENKLPAELQVYGASAEIWLGKPVVRFSTFMSESIKPYETRKSLRAYTFLNNYQADLINPPKKDNLTPAVSINLTINCRSVLGQVDKTVKTTWRAPIVK